MRKTLLLCATALLAACSGGGLFEKEKKYTPLYVYYNPLDPDITSTLTNTDLSPVKNYPNFVNYPDDRTKHGLRGNVSQVRYPLKDARGNPSTWGIGLAFNEAGQLTSVFSGDFARPMDAEIWEFQYDNAAHLVGKVNNPHRYRWPSNKDHFEYDASGRLVKRNSPFAQGDFQTYDYHENENLKRVIPVQNPRNLPSTALTGMMEFNKSSELERMEVPLTSNPFVADAKGSFNDFPSVSTFTYSGGLCTEKLEKIAFIVRGETLDTITCVNRYAYNDKGDLISWEYNGGYYRLDPVTRNEYSIPQTSFTIRFEYDYDKHGNWTTRRTILPDNYADIEWLHRYYVVSTKQKEPASGERPVVSIEREIDYYAFSAKEKAELKKKDAPKFTAVQGRGLYGSVKSLSETGHTVSFDEYGNISYEKWEYGPTEENYDYKSPTEYVKKTTGAIIGPFRITCEGNIRKEGDEKGIELPTEYEFDKHGRLIRYSHADGMSPVVEEYTYDGREKHPAVMTYTFRYEEGKDIVKCKYTYLETDKQGNWTKRKVVRTVESTVYDAMTDKETTSVKTDPEFTETRAISYY